MRVNYCCDLDKRAYEQYYAGQSGHGLPVFYGARTQRGHGIGSLFSGLFRAVFPILKRVAPVIGRKALETGMQIAGDVASGQSLKESAKTRAVNAIQDTINKFVPVDVDQSGSGSRRRKRSRPAKNKTKTKGSKKRKVSKKLDVFSPQWH